jgi:predicted dehydrogenase
VSKLRLGVIGVGHLGKFHAKLGRTIENVELVGVVDPVEAARNQVAADFQTKAFASPAEIIPHIDAAVVAAPTRYHHQVGMELLSAGIHVMMEKPIALSVSEADDLVNEAAKQKLTLQVGHIEQFNPALQAVRNQIGQPKYINAVRASGYTFRSTDVGVVLDLMIHDLDIILSLANSDVVDIQAMGLSVMGGHEDVANTRLTFANGCVADVNASRVSFQPARMTQVYSSSGFTQINFADGTAQAIRPSLAVLNGGFAVNDLPAETKQHLKDNLFSEVLPLEEITTEKTNALLDELHDFVGAVRNGSPPRVTGEQGRDVLALANRILTKISEHAWNGEGSEVIGANVFSQPLLHTQNWPDSPQPVAVPLRKAG